MEQLGDATVLGYHHIQPMVVVIVEPHRQAATKIGDVEPGFRRAIDQLLILVDEELARIARSGGDHQVLVTVVVEVSPGGAVGVGTRRLAQSAVFVAMSRKMPFPRFRNRLGWVR